MKQFILLSIVLLTSLSVFAKNVSSSRVKVEPSSIDQMIKLLDQSEKREGGTVHTRLSLVVQDNGMSTDESPRYAISLGYASMSEWGNIFADFKVSKNVIELISVTNKAPGIFEIMVVELNSKSQTENTTLTVDVRKVFADEKTLRAECEYGDCDRELKTSIEVTRTVTKN